MYVRSIFCFLAIPFLLLQIQCSNNVALQSKTIKDDNCRCSDTLHSIEGLPVYDFVDQMPNYPGGMDALQKYLAKNAKYPVSDSIEDIQGSVYLAFIIDTCGDIRNICIKKPLYPDRLTSWEKECIRVISLMPKWEPGKLNEKKVPVRINIPFHIDWDR